MLRSQVREEIFKLLFRYPFVEDGEMEEQISFVLQELEGKSEKNLTYIQNKVRSIIEHCEEIDSTIETFCDGWNLNRIGKAEIAILRISVYELLKEKDIPKQVSINEAVELTKKYCDEDAKRFINAVLGKIAQNKEKE